MSGIKYLLLSSYTYPDASGSGINAYNMANALNESGNPTKVLSFRRKLRIKKDSSVVLIPYFSKTLFGKLLSLPLILTFYLIFIIRTEVLIVYGNKIIVWEAAILFAKIFRKKVVYRSLLLGVDDISSSLDSGKIKATFHRRIFRYVNCYYSINRKFSEIWIKEIERPELILNCPQGVNMHRFAPEPDSERKLKIFWELKLPTNSHLILSAGFLLYRKNPLQIFQALSKVEFHFNYVYLGDYQYNAKHYLRKKKEESNALYQEGRKLLGDRILFMGNVSNVSDYLKCADVFIHAANDEVPNVVYEAMASGVPVILSHEAVNLTTFLEHESNCLEFRDATEIPILIQKIKTNRVLRDKITQNALDWIEKEASFQQVINNLNHFLFTS